MEERRREIDGVEISYFDEGEGDAVVFIHGLGGYKENWEFNLPHFSRNCRALALDLPGFGHSQKPKRDYSMAFMASTIKGWLDALGVSNPVLVGNSMGGAISTLYSLTYPGAISKLVLVDAAGVNIFPANLLKQDNLPVEMFAAAATGNSDRSVREKAVRSFIRRIFHTEPPVMEKMVRHALEEYFGPDFQDRAQAFLSAAQQLFMTPLRGRLGEIRVPTWVIWGDDDRLLPIENAHAFQKELPHAKITVFPACGHCPMLEYPDEFNRSLDAFLRE